MIYLQGILGLFVLAGLAWLISENRRAVRPRDILAGLGVQFVLALALLKIPACKNIFLLLNDLVMDIQEATIAGTSFVFGYLGGGQAPFATTDPAASFILAFQALPLVLIVSALSSLLFYWRILPVIVKGFSWCLEKTMGVGGAVGLSAAANVFVGMIEAPLFIRPYLKALSRSELFTVMACGMANIAGTVMVLYASILNRAIPDAMGHILIASIVSTPAAILISRIMIPETSETTAGEIMPSETATSSMDAVAKGTIEGVSLLINIIAMLIVLIALVFITNKILGLIPMPGDTPITLQKILGLIMAPIVWLIGIPWHEAITAGSLMGTKTIMNELLAYLELAQLPPEALSDRSRLIMTYALCGFANFGSLGIMLGGMGTMVPERKDEIVEMGVKTIIAGTLATCMTGAVVGVIFAL